MAEFFAELKRRQMFRVAAVYAVVAWLLLQVVNNLTPGLNLPNWVATSVIVVLALGFPVALIFAWIHQLAPADGATARAKASGLDWVLVGGLGIVILLAGYQQLAPTRQTGVDAARNASLNPAGAISVAVLPFTNLSSDPEQEFFSDGITEEITGALAKVPDLRVVARTSAFEFKGQNRNIQTIGQQLQATHIIEGSVRKAGDRVRITAQLINAANGTHIWSENYDRQLTDIFAIQEDIARTVTASLNMSLGLKPGENLVNNRNIDPESYEKVLRAKALFDGRGGPPNMEPAASLLEEVVAKHPDFAPAWMLLGAVYFQSGNNIAGNPNVPISEARTRADQFRTKGEGAGRRAIQLDPNSAGGYAVLAVFTWSRGKPLEADDLFTKVRTLDPNAAEYLLGIGIRLGAAGRVKEAAETLERAYALEPFTPQIALDTAQDRWLTGQNDAAIALAQTLRPINRAPTLAKIYATIGRYGEAADALMEIANDPNSAAAQAAQLLRTAPAKTDSLETLPRLPANLEFVYLHVGAQERAIAVYERRAEVGFLGANTTAFVWHPSYAPVRKTERFKALMRKVGLVEYWRAKGWPEFCKPVGADDFECS